MDANDIRKAAAEMAPRLKPVIIEAMLCAQTEAQQAAEAAGKRPEVSIAEFIGYQDALIEELLDRNLDSINVTDPIDWLPRPPSLAGEPT